MPKMPDYVVIKSARNARNALIGVGVVSGAVSWALIGTPETGTGMTTALIAMLCFIIAAKIKTKRYHRGGIYR